MRDPSRKTRVYPLETDPNVALSLTESDLSATPERKSVVSLNKIDPIVTWRSLRLPIYARAKFYNVKNL